MSVKTKRIFAFDALRAVMMLLGLVLHTSATYGEVDKLAEWPFLDPLNTHLFFDVVIGIIHLFRMPVFFVISGFFGALLFYERSPRRMLLNRVRRIILPFIVFLCVLYPILRFTFQAATAGYYGAAHPFVEAWEFVLNISLIPDSTAHLWFLYYLGMFSVLTWCLALLLRKIPALTHLLRRVFRRLHSSLPAAILVLSALIFILFERMQVTDAYTSTSLLPDGRTFAFYVTFYWYGWLFFMEKKEILQRNFFYKTNLSLGVIFFFIKAVLYLECSPEVAFYPIIICNALAVWCFIFGFIGWFLRKFDRPSARMRYISDASYWVYLIHLPLTALLPTLLFGYDIFVGLKWLFVFCVTTGFCFVTYHFFVRKTFIGRFLNGQKKR